MKTTRILALVTALMMLVSSAALAEAKLHTVTIGNISIQNNADEATKLGLALKLSGGGDADRAVMNMAATGNGNPIADFSAATENGQITLALDGMASNYAIKQADIEKMVADAAGGAQAEGMPLDQKALQDLMTAYGEALKQAAEVGKKPMSAEETAKIYTEMGFVKGADEPVSVNGQQMTLTRYDADLGTKDLDKMMQVSLSRVPAMKDFLVKYFALINDAMAQTGEAPVVLDPDHLIEGMLAQSGGDLRVKMTLWTDDSSRNMRMEMLETVTEKSGDEGAAPMSVTVPITMQVNTDERGQHMSMDMDMDQGGADMVMNFKMNDALRAEGAKGDCRFDMVVAGQALSLAADYDYDAAGKGRMSAGVDVPMGETAITRCALKIGSTGGDVNTHSVQLRVTEMEKAGAILTEKNRVTVGFDVTAEEGALPEGALIDNGKPTVDIPTMTEEQQDTALQELLTKGIMAYGQLMATDGVAALVSDMVMMAKDAFESMNLTEAQVAA